MRVYTGHGFGVEGVAEAGSIIARYFKISTLSPCLAIAQMSLQPFNGIRCRLVAALSTRISTEQEATDFCHCSCHGRRNGAEILRGDCGSSTEAA